MQSARIELLKPSKRRTDHRSAPGAEACHRHSEERRKSDEIGDQGIIANNEPDQGG